MNSNTLRLILILLAATAADAGWARTKTEPTCPVPNGVPCMPTMDVYQATNGADKVTSRAQGQVDTTPMPMPPPTQPVVVAVRAPKPSGPVAYRPAQYAQLQVQGDSLVIDNAPSMPDVPPPRRQSASAEPYRVPAQIMQIYVAPWQDEQGDLHLPERVVTEIEPRHWAMGAPAPDASTSFHLLELPSEAAKDSHPEVSANTSRGQSGITAPTATTKELNR